MLAADWEEGRRIHLEWTELLDGVWRHVLLSSAAA
jgi:hypothetical protein